MVTERIGIIGTGRMGTAFAKRLIEIGNSVTVWNRTPSSTSGAVEAGAKAVEGIGDLVAKSDVLISSLTNFQALTEVHKSPGGLLAQNITGKLVIEMSTLLPEQQQELAAGVYASNAHYLECPVGGTVGPALKGALLGMAGGEKTAFSLAKPILHGLCKRVEHMGPVGAGSAMKLAVNLPLALYWAVLAEAMGVLSDQDISPRLALSVMSDSSAGPAVLKNRMEVIAATLDDKDQTGTFDINGLKKDLQLALDLSGRKNSNMQLSSIASNIYDNALRSGLGSYDGSSLTRYLLRSDSKI